MDRFTQWLLSHYMAPKESCMLRASQKDSLRVIVKLTLRFCLSLVAKRPSPCNTDCYTDDNQTNLIDHLSLKKADLFKKKQSKPFLKTKKYLNLSIINISIDNKTVKEVTILYPNISRHTGLLRSQKLITKTIFFIIL